MPSDSSPSDDRSAPPGLIIEPAPTGSEGATALLDAARQVLRRRFRVVLLIRDAYARLEANTDALHAVWTALRAALPLLVAWARRSYRQVPTASLVLLVAALLYFVTPIDVVPDPLGALGFVDDIAVIQTAVDTVRHELDQFRTWEEQRTLPSS